MIGKLCKVCGQTNAPSKWHEQRWRLQSLLHWLKNLANSDWPAFGIHEHHGRTNGGQESVSPLAQQASACKVVIYSRFYYLLYSPLVRSQWEVDGEHFSPFRFTLVKLFIYQRGKKCKETTLHRRFILLGQRWPPAGRLCLCKMLLFCLAVCDLRCSLRKAVSVSLRAWVVDADRGRRVLWILIFLRVRNKIFIVLHGILCMISMICWQSHFVSHISIYSVPPYESE